jgi:hypothetical protein
MPIRVKGRHLACLVQLGVLLGGKIPPLRRQIRLVTRYDYHVENFLGMVRLPCVINC